MKEVEGSERGRKYSHVSFPSNPLLSSLFLPSSLSLLPVWFLCPNPEAMNARLGVQVGGRLDGAGRGTNSINEGEDNQKKKR